VTKFAGDPKGGTQHRSDIDGLRCLAVLPVVLYHYSVGAFGGGYVGVDVFFVISGYLISGIIYSEVSESRFSLLGFYERRARRILPALFVLLVVTSVLSYFLLFPADLKSFAMSVIWTVFFVSNIGFWKETGYFDALANTKPLLHTWSLAVEEQFYLLFPLLLIALRNASRRIVLFVISAITLGSLALSVALVKNHPDPVFYWSVTRAWELGIGAVLAIGKLPPLTHRYREALAALGLIMIIVAVIAFGNGEPPYMLNLVVPCVGAALLLHAGSHGPTVAGRILSWRPFVLIGLISYSLYLWHWPLYVFVLYAAPQWLSPAGKVLLVLASAGIAALSWRYVERPFRGKSGVLTRPRLFAAAGVAASFIVASAAVIFVLNGLPQRFPADINRLLADGDDADTLPRACAELPLEDLRAGRLCSFGSARADAAPFILWGDSHAHAIEPGLDVWAKRHNRRGIFAVRLGCIPLVGATNVAHQECDAVNDAILAQILANKARDVVLDGLWGLAAESKPFSSDQQVWVLADAQSSGDSASDNHAVFARGINRTVQRLVDGGKHVVIIAAVPEIRWPVSETLAKIRAFGWKVDVPTKPKVFFERQAFADAQFLTLSHKLRVAIIYPDHVLCDRERCEVEADGHALYSDDHHLSVFGANYVVSRLDGELAAAMPR
jgi:peptidoglycan/LPS O-acetylase OafA/YrhL